MDSHQNSGLSNLSVEDLLSLLNSPQEEIVIEVKDLIKDQFSSVSDKWLVTGLLDYYFLTNSKRILDLLLGAPEPHSKFLLERITSGIRSSDKFRYFSVLLYAVSRNPPPIWIHKIPNTILKDLLEILSQSRESDMNVLVSGVMILVLILPALPFEFNKYLPKVFESFWRLVHWTPSREQDNALKPYLQVAVYSLFHRLYALYPCNLLGYLRVNMVGQANKAWFLNTLRPMLERVRLHPLLVSETKDTEIAKSRWVRLEPNDLIHECAKLCLDPLHEICEEMHFNNPPRRQSICEYVPETSDYIILCSSENSFWSPGAIQSPSTVNTSVPHTPVYAQFLGNQSTGLVESPPEAAVEATPETTPFTSPTPVVSLSKEDPRTSIQRPPKLKTTPLNESSIENRSPNPLSPSKKDFYPFKFPVKHSQDILLKSEKSDFLQTKLQEIQQQRIMRQKEDKVPSFLDNSKTIDIPQDDDQVCLESKTSSRESKTVIHDSENKKEIVRKRKIALCTNYSNKKEMENEVDLFFEDKVSEQDYEEPEVTTSLENDSISSSNRKGSGDSEASNNEGLGLPSRRSMTELVKSVKTNRLRFLSRCGPPPNIALLNDIGAKQKLSPRKANKLFSLGLKHKSLSYPNLLSDNSYIFPLMSKRDHTISSLTLSPVKPMVETVEVSTQTEEVPIIDPYEQFLELLMVPKPDASKDVNKDKEKISQSPYEVLDQLIEYGDKDFLPPTQDSGNIFNETVNDKTRNHLRAMQCVLMLERYKREVHAERNRRLLGKIKKLHLLQEKDSHLDKERKALKESMLNMNQIILNLQEKNIALEEKLNEMVEKKTLFEIKEKQLNATCQRDNLKKLCDSLQKDKLALTKELENSRSSTRESQRQLKIHARHSSENVALRNQVDKLNKRILIMGEIQLEMHQQIKNYKESQRQALNYTLAMKKAAFSQKVQELEYKHKTEKTSLEAAMFRINELERKLAVQHTEKLNHQKEIDSIVASWQERCDSLSKRNDNLRSINSTLESQMTQLLTFRPERESEAGAEARRLVPPTGRDGFPSTVDSQERQVLPETSTLYLSRMTSNEFRPVGFPNMID